MYSQRWRGKGRINVHLQFKRAGKLTNKGKDFHVNVTLKPKIVDLDSFQKGTVVQKVPSKTAVKFQFCASFTKKCWSSGEYDDYILLLPLMLDPK